MHDLKWLANLSNFSFDESCFSVDLAFLLVMSILKTSLVVKPIIKIGSKVQPRLNTVIRLCYSFYPPIITFTHPRAIVPPCAHLSPILAAGLPPITTVVDLELPLTLTSPLMRANAVFCICVSAQFLSSVSSEIVVVCNKDFRSPELIEDRSTIDYLDGRYFHLSSIYTDMLTYIKSIIFTFGNILFAHFPSV